MSLRIRKAKSSDYDSLLPLYNQIDLLHRESLPEIFVKPEGMPREREYFQELLQQPEVGFFIAEERDQTIGFVHVIVRKSPPLAVFAPRRYAVVESIVVERDHQALGVGRKLMAAVHEWARDNGAESVELNVFEFNQDAVSFYDRLGYKTLSRKMRKSLINRDKGKAG